MKALSKFIFLIVVSFAVLVPASASAAICPMNDNSNSTKCKIPICALRPGGISESKCYGPYALMAWRAYWGQNPIPLADECPCNWLPDALIPTDQYGVPISVTTTGNNLLQTPFEKPIYLGELPVVKMAQLSDIDRSSPLIFGGEVSPKSNTPADTPISKTSDYFTTCRRGSFKRSGRSKSCYTISGGARTDIVMRHKKYRKRLKRRHQYDYSIRSRNLDGGGTTSETKMQIRHKTMTYCQRFENGKAITNRSCGVSNLNNFVQRAPDILNPTTPGYPIDPGTTPGGTPGGPGGTPGDVRELIH